MLEFGGMKKVELQSLVNSLIPKFYSFAYALMPDELQAQQMVIDAYAVFLVREKKFIREFNYKPQTKEKTVIKRYIMAHILSELFQMGLKRSAQLRLTIKGELGIYDSFYRLKTLHRAVLFLKENFHYSVEGIQEVLGLEKYQVIESLYNARETICSNDDIQGSAQYV